MKRRSNLLENEYRQYKIYITKNGIQPFSENEVICTFKYWLLVKNMFPWNLIVKRHDLLIPKRKVQHLSHLNLHEKTEMLLIVERLQKEYKQLTLNGEDQKPVAKHLHWHCTK